MAAKVEAQKITERTKACMARAKSKGIRIGRPRLDIELRQKIAPAGGERRTAYAIAQALGIDGIPQPSMRVRVPFLRRRGGCLNSDCLVLI